MMPRSYPTPHPYIVAGLKDGQQWNYKGRPIPDYEAFAAYSAREGHESTPEAYDTWRAEVEAVMAANAKADRPKPSPVAAERLEIPAAPSSAMPMLRHLQAKRQRPRLEAMNVRIPESTLAALDRYVRHHGVAKQDVVADMLDHMLTAAGFAPAAD